VNYIEIVPLLISQIQSLQEQIDELKQEMKLTHLAEEPKDPASPLPPLELKLE
jgi:transposase